MIIKRCFLHVKSRGRSIAIYHGAGKMGLFDGNCLEEKHQQYYQQVKPRLQRTIPFQFIKHHFNTQMWTMCSQSPPIFLEPFLDTRAPPPPKKKRDHYDFHLQKNTKRKKMLHLTMTWAILVLNLPSLRSFSTWWLNQPTWKICSSNWIISLGIGVKIKNIWNHQPDEMGTSWEPGNTHFTRGSPLPLPREMIQFSPLPGSS